MHHVAGELERALHVAFGEADCEAREIGGRCQVLSDLPLSDLPLSDLPLSHLALSGLALAFGWLRRLVLDDRVDDADEAVEGLLGLVHAPFGEVSDLVGDGAAQLIGHHRSFCPVGSRIRSQQLKRLAAAAGICHLMARCNPPEWAVAAPQMALNPLTLGASGVGLPGDSMRQGAATWSIKCYRDLTQEVPNRDARFEVMFREEDGCST